MVDNLFDKLSLQEPVDMLLAEHWWIVLRHEGNPEQKDLLHKVVQDEAFAVRRVDVHDLKDVKAPAALHADHMLQQQV